MPLFISLGITALTLVPAPPLIAAPATTTGMTCPQPAVERFRRHRVASGETVTSLAQQYQLNPATLMGINPSLRAGSATPGSEIFIPPFDGVLLNLARGTTLNQVARTYGVPPGVLFEVNGCRLTPRTVFIPGVLWSPQGVIKPTLPQDVATTATLGEHYRYPLPVVGQVLTNFGWQVNAQTNRREFHNGVDLTALGDSPVLAAAAGTVAFAGKHPDQGLMVVINHAGGLQTRYAQLGTVAVQTGQRVDPGTTLGTVAPATDTRPAHLHFEVRKNTGSDWVAQDPNLYLSPNLTKP